MGGTSARGACLGYPQPGQEGGSPARGSPPGVPPMARSGWGYPSQGAPAQGTPPARSGWGGQYPSQGAPTRGTPPARSGGGYPSQGGTCLGSPPQYRTAHGILDKRRSVCLLRSRRRTVLFYFTKR